MSGECVRQGLRPGPDDAGVIKEFDEKGKPCGTVGMVRLRADPVRRLTAFGAARVSDAFAISAPWHDGLRTSGNEPALSLLP